MISSQSLSPRRNWRSRQETASPVWKSLTPASPRDYHGASVLASSTGHTLPLWSPFRKDNALRGPSLKWHRGDTGAGEVAGPCETARRSRLQQLETQWPTPAALAKERATGTLVHCCQEWPVEHLLPERNGKFLTKLKIDFFFLLFPSAGDGAQDPYPGPLSWAMSQFLFGGFFLRHNICRGEATQLGSPLPP